MRLIGISGKFCSGKDTLAGLIIKHYENKGYKTANLKFADSLKNICSILTGTNIDEQYTQEGKAKENILNMTNGRLQQLIGTKLREIDENIWINPIIEYYKNNPETICIISDCRFKNEAQAIKQNGGILIRINRNIPSLHTEVLHFKNNGRDVNHISETDLDDYNFDYTISNNGTIKDLEHWIKFYLKFKHKNNLEY